MSSALIENVQKYIIIKDVYLANAKKMIDEGELRKASEFFWGACIQTIFSLASIKENIPNGHAAVRQYIIELGKEINDPDISKSFSDLEKLHANFYHGMITKEDFPRYQEEAINFIDKIQNLLTTGMKSEIL